MNKIKNLIAILFCITFFENTFCVTINHAHDLIHDHGSIITSVAFSPNGNLLATASSDHTAKIWDLNGILISTLRHEQAVNFVVFSPNGQMVLTSSQDGKVSLWTVAGDLIYSFSQTPAKNLLASFYPETDLIITYNKTSSKAFNSNQYLIDIFGYLEEIPRTYPGFTINFAKKLWISGPCKFDFYQGEDAIGISFAKSRVTIFEPEYSYQIPINSNCELLFQTTKKLKINAVAATIFPGSNQYHPSALIVIGYTGNREFCNYCLTLLKVDNQGHITQLANGPDEYSDNINSVSISQNGKYILTGSDNNIAKLWLIGEL